MSEHHYSFGSGMIGCLYDNGPHFTSVQQVAIDSLAQTFEDVISEEEMKEMREELRDHGLHYFAKPEEVGAHYCDVTKQNGPCPEEDDD